MVFYSPIEQIINEWRVEEIDEVIRVKQLINKSLVRFDFDYQSNLLTTLKDLRTCVRVSQ